MFDRQGSDEFSIAAAEIDFERSRTAENSAERERPRSIFRHYFGRGKGSPVCSHALIQRGTFHDPGSNRERPTGE